MASAETVNDSARVSRHARVIGNRPDRRQHAGKDSLLLAVFFAAMRDGPTPFASSSARAWTHATPWRYPKTPAADIFEASSCSSALAPICLPRRERP